MISLHAAILALMSARYVLRMMYYNKHKNHVC